MPKHYTQKELQQAAELLATASYYIFIQQFDPFMIFPGGQQSTLHYSVRNPYPHMTRELLEAGVDVNAKDKWGQTPLYAAVRCKADVEHLCLLIESGADYRNVNNLHIIELLTRQHRTDDIPKVQEAIALAEAKLNTFSQHDIPSRNYRTKTPCTLLTQFNKLWNKITNRPPTKPAEDDSAMPLLTKKIR